MKDDTKLGELITDGEKRRDAVHVAVAPVTCADDGIMIPGALLKLIDRENAVCCDWEEAVGIVDPFLTQSCVKKGQRFWMFLLPNTITGLRHSWRHPAFDKIARENREKV